jgi:glycosyltransferase involved in cell wall biosynthesis
MKIVHTHPGLLPIPPNGWGAIEKLIWFYHVHSLNKGHTSEIRYTNDINKNEFDIVHVHVGNLANILHERNIPYFFSMNDHHAYLYGKDSPTFKENYLAAKNSIHTFVSAKFLVDYFDLPNVSYLSLGVDNSFFKPKNDIKEHKLLCVANNGFGHDSSEDRKGFSYAIEAARKLNMPITIAGPKNNQKFFDRMKVQYDKLDIRFDLTEQQLVETYQEHTIFIHPSILEGGHPNLTLLEAQACGLIVLATFEKNNSLKGLIRIERNHRLIADKIKETVENYNFYKKITLESAQENDWSAVVDRMLNIYNIETSK